MSRARETRERVITAAAKVFAERGVLVATRRDVAKAANVPMQTVSAIARRRVDLLKLVIEKLPPSQVAARFRQLAEDPTEPPVQSFVWAVRGMYEDPSMGWSPLELEALTAAPYDDEIRQLESERFEKRWAAASKVIHRVRGDAGDLDSIPDDLAALHMLAVGVGVAILSPLADRVRDPEAWGALISRLLESIAADESPLPHRASVVWRARVTASENAASTGRLMRALSAVDVQVANVFTAKLDGGRQLVELVLDAPPDVTRDTIAHALASFGRDIIVSSGAREMTGDIASRLLRLSAQVVAQPDSAPRAAAALVLADSWEIAEPASGEDASLLVMRLQWTFDRHVILRRNETPFTPAERERASALLELVVALGEARGTIDDFGWHEVARDGRDITIRLARPEDAEHVEQMHQRCSQESRYYRYFAPQSVWREEQLRRLTGGHRGATLVVTDAEGVLIGLGNLFPLEEGALDVGEFAVIVEDAWHRQGIGRLVVQRLVDVARRQGFAELIAYVMAGNRSMIGLLERSGLTFVGGPDPEMGPAVLAMRARLD